MAQKLLLVTRHLAVEHLVSAHSRQTDELAVLFIAIDR
jgi:hypothetical protein